MEKNIIEILCELVNIPSFGSINNEHLIIKYLKKCFDDNSQEIIGYTSENGNSHLLIGVNTKLSNIENGILLSGHIDTVKQSEGHEPISRIENNSVIGLGSADMKAFIASIISNINSIKLMNKPVVISFVYNHKYLLFISVAMILLDLFNDYYKNHKKKVVIRNEKSN